MLTNPVVETYSRLAADYDRECNSESCWVSASRKALAAVTLCDRYRVVADVGCGTGRALAKLAASALPQVKFVGIEPAPNMRLLARQYTQAFPSVQILDGCFEDMPLESDSLDYLFSIFAFHWARDLDRSASETARVLKREADMDLFFVGRNNGR